VSLKKNEEGVTRNRMDRLVKILKSNCAHTQSSGGKPGEWNLGI
jgi:hypothetical protein